MTCGESCDVVAFSDLHKAGDLFAQGLKLLDQQKIDGEFNQIEVLYFKDKHDQVMTLWQ